ncbi:MAG: septum formation protein Maf [Desulfuromonadaceae bacterium GWC2_58_13]|nr:MAG: septum formation protein Maf [Desulfuromonadaceae bacterium GWC2_58_13]
MTSPVNIVLASASPRRRELLERIGIRFTVVPSDTSEDEIPGESPEEHVLRLARNKALDVAGRRDVAGRWFIGSDTIVLRDDCILGKPADPADAAAMLRSLSGRTHRVLSGYAVHDRQTGATVADVVSTRVRFKELTATEIAGYIATGEPMDKAGAYAIQGIGVFMVLAIEGSYTNVVGLPLCEVIEVLERLGAVRLFAPAP